MKTKIYIIFVSFFMISASFFITATESSKEKASLTETYANKEKHYSISYPSEWQKKDVPALDLVLFASTKDSKEPPHASMNAVSIKLETEVTLERFYSESISNLTAELKEVKIDHRGDKEVNGIPSKWIIYSHIMQGSKFSVLQYFFVSHDSVYLITFSALADDFDGYKATFEKIASTFRFL